MRIPSQNLLKMALSVIKKQTFEYYAYVSRDTGANGVLVSTYADPVVVQGSFQPIPRYMFEQLNLPLQGNYAYIFVPQATFDVARDSSGDQFTFNNQTWQLLSKTPWSALDGWDSVLCVQVPNTENFYISESGFVYSNEAGNQFYATE